MFATKTHQDLWQKHRWFQGLPGSAQIATLYACQALWWWLNRRRPRSILEIGGGIGCLSAVLARWRHQECNTEVSTVEDNPWCLEQWRKNLGSPPAIRLCASIPRGTWDFVVVDGEQTTTALWECLAHRAVIVVEGNRRAQRAEITGALGRHGRAFCWAPWRPWDRSKGVWVLQADPRRWERVWFRLVRGREWARDLPWRLVGWPVGKGIR